MASTASEIDPISARRSWIGVLNGELSRSTPSGTVGVRVGILGALGTYDVGDEAMLISLQDELRDLSPGYSFTVFSQNPRRTDNYIQTRSYGTLHRWVFDRKSLVSVGAFAVDQIERQLCKLLRFIGLNEVDIGGFAYRGLYTILKQLLFIEVGRHTRGKGPLFSKHLHRHVKSISELDVLVFLGGGYINSWHVKSHIRAYLLSAEVAQALGVKLLSTGWNIGPLGSLDRRYVERVLSSFSAIGVRDHDESFSEIRLMDGVAADVAQFSNDDAWSLKGDLEGNDALRTVIDRAGPFVVVHLHQWLLARSGLTAMLDAVSTALDGFLDRHDYRVVGLPMTYADENREGSSGDAILLKELQSRSRHPERYMILSDLLSPKQRKWVAGRAAASIVSRHHAFVFSLSSGVPSLAICLDPYYSMKLNGVAVGCKTEAVITPIEALSADGIQAFLHQHCPSQ